MLRWDEVTAVLGCERPENWPAGDFVKTVECHPARSGPEVLFCSFPEFHTYQKWWDLPEIWQALSASGCRALVGPPETPVLPVPVLRFENPALACARLARKRFQSASHPLSVLGVTGTNGKTTSVRLLGHLLNQLGVTAGTLGTLGLSLRDALLEPGEYTTDLAPDLHRKLGKLEQGGARYAAVEVSSHALALQRVGAVDFKAALVTNVSRDHLDFHGSLSAYKAAKRKLVEGLSAQSVAVLNADDPSAAEFAGSTAAHVVTFGKSSWSDLRLIASEFSANGTTFSVSWKGVRGAGFCQLIGDFQLHNVLGGVALLLALGFDLEGVLKAVSTFGPVEGRMEQLRLPNGALIVIDFAHNPDGLRRVLTACDALKARRLRLVFGCGGDRDRGKRPLMGALAQELCAEGWITSDNPRTEDPRRIADDILKGMKPGKAFNLELNRRKAIFQALDTSKEGDVIVIAGKGHEDYQIVGTEKQPYSDREVVREWMARGDQAGS
jgi:UDP-N-acetylmuramoyl-L-alanyl-D-glutamate--2,6-diaminopimelate ligase